MSTATKTSGQYSDSSYAEANIQWCWVSINKLQKQKITLHPLDNNWVHLISEENEEVLLLCPESETEWVTWSPECGEKIVSVNEFCVVPTN